MRACFHPKQKMDYYAVLKVSPLSNYEEIKAAYHKSVRIVHPDKQQQNVQIQQRRNHPGEIPKQNEYNQEENDNGIENEIRNEPQTQNEFQQSNSTVHNTTNNTVEYNSNNNIRGITFRQIQDAWECLRDTRKRQIYDQKCFGKNSKILNAIILTPDDCIEKEYSGCTNDTDTDDDDGIILLYTCRCGYIINTSELNDIEDEFDDPTTGSDVHKNNVHIQCPGCSLHYLLILD